MGLWSIMRVLMTQEQVEFKLHLLWRYIFMTASLNAIFDKSPGLGCSVHRAALLRRMRLLVNDLLGQLHQLLGQIHIVSLGASFLDDLGRCNCGNTLANPEISRSDPNRAWQILL